MGLQLATHKLEVYKVTIKISKLDQVPYLISHIQCHPCVVRTSRCRPIKATITVEALHQGVDFALPITRAKFEELNQDLFKKTLDVSFGHAEREYCIRSGRHDFALALMLVPFP